MRIILFFFFWFFAPLAAKTIVFPTPPEIYTCTHKTGHTTNNFFPNLKFNLTPVFVSSSTAFSLLAEVGVRNYRANATLGYIPCDPHRLKLTVEYLVQKMHFNFTSKQISTSVHQIAGGLKYQYRPFSFGWWRGFELGGTYSYSPSHTLKRRVCKDTEQTNNRHIAGATSGGGSLGLAFVTFDCGSLTIAGNYEHVTFHRRYDGKKEKNHDHSVRKIVQGFGASLEWNQRFCSMFDWSFKAEFLRPYNYFEGALKWVVCLDGGDLTFGIFGGHTVGKHGLPSSSQAGVSLGYSFGVQDFMIIAYDCAPIECACSPCELHNWVASPAVYIPEVLAIADQRVICQKPVTTKTIPPQIEQPGPYFFDVSAFFTAPQQGGVALTFSAKGLPADASIDPKAGFITGNNTLPTTQSFTVTVTVSDKCGSASQTFTLTYVGSGF